LAVTIAATLATAPLIAFHFETLSTTTLLANVLVLPAVPPAMWLGMLGAALAQVPGIPLEPLNGLAALLLAYVAQVASWCAAPSWAEVHLHLGLGGLVLAYLALAACLVVLWRFPRAVAVAVLVGGAAAGLALATAPGEPGVGQPGPLRIEVLDVGQGDAILLEPHGAPAVLVDGGPFGDGLEAKLEAAGVQALGAAVITHDQADHAAGVEELFGRFPIARLLYARLRRTSLAEAGRRAWRRFG
jgi:competence protein ComEC